MVNMLTATSVVPLKHRNKCKWTPIKTLNYISNGIFYFINVLSWILDTCLRLCGLSKKMKMKKKNWVYRFFARICHNNGFISETGTFSLNGLSQWFHLPRSITIFFCHSAKWQKVHLVSFSDFFTSSEQFNRINKNAENARLKCSATQTCWASFNCTTHHLRAVCLSVSIFPQLTFSFFSYVFFFDCRIFVGQSKLKFTQLFIWNASQSSWPEGWTNSPPNKNKNIKTLFHQRTPEKRENTNGIHIVRERASKSVSQLWIEM